VCDITYDDALLSRKHAEFVTSGDSVIVRDLGSRNGVFVNGAKIAERTLRSGDVVQIGPVRARYVADTAPVAILPEQIDADYTAVIHHDDPKPAPPRAAAPAVVAAAPAAPARPRPAPDDEDPTRLIPGPRAVPTAESAVKPAAAAVGDDNDETEFLRSPVAARHAVSATASPMSAAGGPSRPITEEDLEAAADATIVFPRSDAPRAAAPSVAAAPVAAPPAAASPEPIAPLPAPARPSAVNASAAVNPPAVANPHVPVSPPSALRPSTDPARAAAAERRTPQPDDAGSLSSYVVARVMVLAAIVLVAAVVPLMMWRGAPGQMSLGWFAVPVAVAAVAAYTVGGQINRRFAHALAAANRNRS
jgi:hypothetical protein